MLTQGCEGEKQEVANSTSFCHPHTWSRTSAVTWYTSLTPCYTIHMFSATYSKTIETVRSSCALVKIVVSGCIKSIGQSHVWYIFKILKITLPQILGNWGKMYACLYTDNAAWTQSISYLWHIRGTLCQLLFQPSHQQNAFASDALKMQTMITSVCPALGSRVQWFCTFLRFSKLVSDTWLPIGIFLEVQFKKWACFDTYLAKFAFNKKKPGTWKLLSF